MHRLMIIQIIIQPIKSAVNNSSSNQVVNEDSQLFNITNILIILFALIIGFLAVILIFKLFK